MADTKGPPGPPCPECGRDMEAGFVTATQSIQWAADEAQGGFFGAAAEALRTGSWVRHPRYPAHRCRPCRVVVFQY